MRVDNLIFSNEASSVAAVLDWELSTLGHPGTDVALLTLPYVTPATLPRLAGFVGIELLVAARAGHSKR